jgi:hypothetical protein
MAKTEKPTTKNFVVTYPDGTEVVVLRLPPTQLEEATAIAEKIFERFFTYWEYSRDCLGDVLADPAAWGYIKQLASLLPVAGQKEKGIDVDLLATDFEQIGQIFMTQSISMETGTVERVEGEIIKPSKFAELNKLNFFKVRAIEAVKKQQEQEAKEQETTTTPSPVVETELPTS